MGEGLYHALGEESLPRMPCGVYSLVGAHKDLLPYLVRRLLENGANTSLVNRIADDAAPIEDVIRNPIELLESAPYEPRPGIPLPSRMFAPERVNSTGIDLSDCASAAPLCAAIE